MCIIAQSTGDWLYFILVAAESPRYVWGYLHDAKGNLYKSYGSGTVNLKLSFYRPNGSCAHTYTYNNCDNNWIRQTLNVAGTWRIESEVMGALSGTNIQTITVRPRS